MEEVTDRLQAALDYAGVSQAELARACGISTAAVSKWFSGRTKYLRPEHLFEVADRLQVDVRWLGTGRGEMLAGSDHVDRIAEAPAPGYSAVSRERIELWTLYDRLPGDARRAVRRIMQLLARREMES